MKNSNVMVKLSERLEKMAVFIAGDSIEPVGVNTRKNWRIQNVKGQNGG